MNNRILYSMFYDMLEQTHYAYKSKNGVAIVCPNTPVWLKLAQGTSAHARLFFRDFLDGYVNREQLVGIVAEKNVATACAKVYAQENSITFAQKELIAYFLPQGVEMGLNDSGLNALGKGELRPATASEMPLVSEWISAFYSETLAAAQPLFENGTAAFHQLHESIPQSQVPPKQQETHS
ncbi:MAG: hypothetical protein FWC89_11820, partial [Defluviitaleaceae bacterium]|nr:hypothetical protein [Defluviitaleaceae bacterium]